jgi:hypothetical protein
LERRRFGALQEEPRTINNQLASTVSDLGLLSLELATLLNPASAKEDDGSGQMLIPPPSFPSLFEQRSPPNGMQFISVRTSREQISINETSGNKKAYIYFAPGGYSDFAAIEMQQAEGQKISFIVNPFTKQVDIYRNATDLRFEDLFQSLGNDSSVGNSQLESGNDFQ